MEEKQKSATSNGITWGIVAGVLMILYSLILYLMDENLNPNITWISYLFLIGAMIWGTLEYRKKLPGGYMPYGKAYSASFMIVLFGAILAGIYSYLFFQVIAPEAVQDIIDLARQQNIERNPELTEEQLDQAIQMTSFIYTPAGLTIMGFISSLVIGAIIALITSIFLKKEDKTLTSSAI